MMPADRRERLEGLKGWMWDTRAANWEEAFTLLTAYVKAEGRAEIPPQSYKTAEGFLLGSWITAQRGMYKKGRLSEDRIRRLEGLNSWVWDGLAALWEKGFARFTAYMKANGSTRVPKGYCDEDGYQLGNWIAGQRRLKSKLSADRRERLEALDGWEWDVHGAKWEEGFAHLAAYVQAEGTARVPYGYRTADGYPLGRWVDHQRGTKDTLRRTRLETLDGWVWTTRARSSTKKP